MNKIRLIYLLLILFIISGCNTASTISSGISSDQQGGYTSSYFYIEPSKTSLLVGANETFCVYKCTYNSVTGESISLINPTWTLAGNIGTITKNGTFTATKEGIGYAIASYEGSVEYVTVTVTNEAAKTSPAIPAGLTISNVATNIAMISWNAVTYASGYTVRYSTIPLTFTGTTVNSSNPSILLTSLSPNTTYYVQVRAYNDYGYSRYCSTEIFTTGK